MDSVDGSGTRNRPVSFGESTKIAPKNAGWDRTYGS
jgi:hypothetical protein